MIDAANAGDFERMRSLINVYGARINQGHTKNGTTRFGAERRVRGACTRAAVEGSRRGWLTLTRTALVRSSLGALR